MGIRLYVEVDLPGREFPLQRSPDMIVTVLALLAESAEKKFLHSVERVRESMITKDIQYHSLDLKFSPKTPLSSSATNPLSQMLACENTDSLERI